MGMRFVDEPRSGTYRVQRPSRRGIPTTPPDPLCRSSRRWRYLQLRDAGLDEISSWRLAADITIDLHRFIRDLEDRADEPTHAVRTGLPMTDDVSREESDGGRHG